MQIERNSVKYLTIQIIAIAVAGMIIYPLLDFLLCKFVTNSQFIYSKEEHIIEPIFFAIIIGTTLWLIDKKRK